VRRSSIVQHKVRVGKMDIGLRFQNRCNSWYFYSRGGTNRRSKVKLPDVSFTVPPSVADQIGVLDLAHRQRDIP